MNKLTLVAGAILTMAALGAHAHAHLKASNPKEGAVVKEMPASISLTFSESSRITSVSIQKDQEPKQKLTAPTSIGEQISVEVPELTAGRYTLSWRVASTDDSHIMSGELHFNVAPMKPRARESDPRYVLGDPARRELHRDVSGGWHGIFYCPVRPHA